jgi:hypothetical protein
MSGQHLREHYTQRKNSFNQAVQGHGRILRWLGLFRLLCIVLMVWALVLGIRNENGFWFLGSVLMILCFTVLVVRYNRQKELRELNIRLRDLNARELAVLDHRFQELEDGHTFADHAHPWSHDLDLFGTGSLFQYLNRTATWKGRQQLAGLLTTEPHSLEEVARRQEICRALRDRVDFRQQFTAQGEMFHDGEEELEGIRSWLGMSAYVRSRPILVYLAWLVSLLSMAIIVRGFFVPSAFKYLLPVLLFNFFLLSPYLLRTNRYQEGIGKKHALLRGYALLLGILAGEDLDQEELRQNRDSAREGMAQVRKLSRLVNLFDQRLNMLLGAVFNGLFLFDFQLLFLLERWKEKNRDRILEWIEITGWTDAHISLAGFAYNHPGYAFPELTPGDSGFRVENLGHPLIPGGKRVDNDLSTDSEKVVIITGANMAGKSTFLRSLGVNLVLAYAGCPVCASRFRMGFMGLFSSMRTSDSLADEESYFLAEIRRLQRIVKRMRRDEPMLILLDEVLKGTNTTDKKKGSVGLIHRCLGHPVRCFIATHDLSLGELEAQLKGQVLNYCFESYIRDMELHFDYTIRPGLATNMNASFLMKQMGIMDEPENAG